MVRTITSANPLIPYQNIHPYHQIPTSSLNPREYFLLPPNGDTIINPPIHQPHLLLITTQQDLHNPQIPPLLIHPQALLKTLFNTHTPLILHSQNPNYEPIILRKQS
ncbi:S24 family peptidase, partial [Siminovitchia fortis]|uniref:S24 family peptidase n=1 Tax=Siminovitchia fortis TaxID=254758 RepID=UPI0036F23479